VLLLLAGRAAAGPDPEGAVRALVATPFDVTGDAFGALGLVGASTLGLCGDGLSFLDANPVTKPILFGVMSGAVRRVALGLSQGSTGFLEGLRAEDVQRLPEPDAAYLENAPGVGRPTPRSRAGSRPGGGRARGPGLLALRAVGARHSR
jgi:hypothetical protein